MYKFQKWSTSNELDNKRFLLCTDGENEYWEKLLLDYRCVRDDNGKVFCYKLEQSNILTLEEQIYILTSIPNDHFWSWSNQISTNIKFEQRLPTCVRYFAASPRNRIIQACCYREDPGKIVSAVLEVLMGRNDVTIPYAKEKKVLMVNIDADITCNKKQSKTYGHRKRPFNKISIETLSTNINCSNVEELPSSSNTSSVQLNLFQYYCGQLFNHGVLKWRYMDETMHIVLMNDYDSDTGDFLCNDFIHISVTSSTLSPIYNCSCKIFSISSSHVDATIVNYCLHVRLLKSLLSLLAPFVEPALNDTCYINVFVMNEGLKFSSIPVIELPSRLNVNKFSVVANQSVAIVTIYKVSGSNRRVAQCHNSSCMVNEGSKRALKYLNSESVSEVCCHLVKLRECWDLSSFNSDLNEDFDIDVLPMDGSELPDEKWIDLFDDATGLWKFGISAPSKQQVDRDPFSPGLVRELNKRVQWIHNQSVYPSFDGVCECGAGWTTDAHPEGQLFPNGTSNLYTDRGVILVHVFFRRCVGMSCIRYWDGAEHCVFRISSSTCAGYEIGWDFVDSVQTSGQTFSGYVTNMSNRYKRMCNNALPFMSNSVFISWFFGWTSHMGIDFREQCTMCGDSNRILACDGTKLGIGFKQTFVKPIETPEIEEVSKTTFRRFDRCFIPNTKEKDPKDFAQARKSIRTVCETIMNQCANHDVLSLAASIDFCIPVYAKAAFNRMLTGIDCSPQERTALAEFFLLLAADASMDSLIPYRFCSEVSSFMMLVLENCVTINDVKIFVHKSKYYCPELSSLVLNSVNCSSNGNPRSDVAMLVDYIAKAIINIHTFNEPCGDIRVIENSYNPAKYGRAYYFTQHGCQIRRMRDFTIDKEDRKKIVFDDHPDVSCDKQFPSVSKKGTTYAFFWFCPVHGHCYGFHIIPGSEGRKDPAASLYTHCPEAPDDLFYDFACNLSEYCKNRESQYFSKTRFFHDIFHGYTHKCSNAFKYNRLTNSSQVNTSICEQFNSYIQKIKRSAKLMSQAHFMFHVQFFIYLWNKSKRSSFQRKLNIVQQGSQN
ncbi:uncharacterized protein LOC124818179 [Hydra vulgaris]|uniref:uncharacterized protein LOC124818179 n=1 Tax=Hydra vulgaris TaxID=6087 RepID=UPI0032EA611A